MEIGLINISTSSGPGRPKADFTASTLRTIRRLTERSAMLLHRHHNHGLVISGKLIQKK